MISVNICFSNHHSGLGTLSKHHAPSTKQSVASSVTAATGAPFCSAMSALAAQSRRVGSACGTHAFVVMQPRSSHNTLCGLIGCAHSSKSVKALDPPALTSRNFSNKRKAPPFCTDIQLTKLFVSAQRLMGVLLIEFDFFTLLNSLIIDGLCQKRPVSAEHPAVLLQSQ